MYQSFGQRICPEMPMLVRKLNVARATRVVGIEIVLILGFLSGLWFILSLLRPEFVPPLKPYLLYGFWLVCALFLGMVSYGTSFQVTPLALLFMLVPLPPIRRYIKRQRLVEWVDRPDTEDGPFSKLEEQATLTVAAAAEPEMDHDKVQ